MPGGRLLLRAGFTFVPLFALVALLLAGGTPAPEVAAAQPAQPADAPAPFKLEKGDHICITGNTFGEQLQFGGYLGLRINEFAEHRIG